MGRETGRDDAHEDDAWPTADELAEMVPASEFFPAETFAQLETARRGRTSEPAKSRVTMRIDSDTLAAFKATGPGWQSRMNAVLGLAAKQDLIGASKPRKRRA